jgi:hypothetical protein
MARMPVLLRLLVVFSVMWCAGCAARRVPGPPFASHSPDRGDGVAQGGLSQALADASQHAGNSGNLWW